MPLNAEILKDMIKTNLIAAGFDVENEHAKTEPFCQAIADAVVLHITTSALVNVGNGSIS